MVSSSSHGLGDKGISGGFDGAIGCNPLVTSGGTAGSGVLEIKAPGL